MSDLERELGDVLTNIRRGHDVVPFMERMLSASDIRLTIMPDDMMHLLEGSADFRPLVPGAAPTWFQVSAEGDHAAELVIYRTRADVRYYIIAPV